MKTIKCDVCGKYDEHGDTTVEPLRSTLGFFTHRYPDIVDLCHACYKEYRDVTERWLKAKRPALVDGTAPKEG